MKALRLAIVLGLLEMHSFAQPFDIRSATSDPELMAALRNLTSQSAYVINRFEVGAFLVRQADGRIRCLLWPDGEHGDSAGYHGVLPEGIVAMAHTHPPAGPEPSNLDIAEAHRIRVPSFVLTRSDLYAIDPSSGESIHLINNRIWTLATKARCTCESSWSPTRYQHERP